MDKPPAEFYLRAIVCVRLAKAVRDGIVEPPEKMPAALRGEYGRLIEELKRTGEIDPSSIDEALRRRIARRFARMSVGNPELAQLYVQYAREELDKLVKNGEFVETTEADGKPEWDCAQVGLSTVYSAGQARCQQLARIIHEAA